MKRHDSNGFFAKAKNKKSAKISLISLISVKKKTHLAKAKQK